MCTILGPEFDEVPCDPGFHVVLHWFSLIIGVTLNPKSSTRHPKLQDRAVRPLSELLSILGLPRGHKGRA